MARAPKPWRRKDTGAWYAEISGRKVRLADPDATAPEAARVLRALLVERDRGRDAVPVSRTVGELVARFLAWCEGQVQAGEMSARNLSNHRERLRRFVGEFKGQPAGDLKPRDVSAWIAGQGTWGPTYRSGVLSSVKRVFNWSAEQEWLPVNPLARLPKPAQRRREVVPDPETARRAMDACLSPEFRLLMQVVYETGCRPSEARAVEARDLDLKAGVWVRPGKTTRRTGKPRVVRLTAALVPVFARLARERPSGPLLRNADGQPWTSSAVNCQVRRLRKRSGLGKEVTLYGLRHLWVTDALSAGVPIATVAELAGHSSTAMISRVYSHLSEREQHLRDALEQVRGNDRGEPKPAP